MIKAGQYYSLDRGDSPIGVYIACVEHVNHFVDIQYYRRTGNTITFDPTIYYIHKDDLLRNYKLTTIQKATDY